MRSFTYYNPVKVYFGKGAVWEISGELEKYGNRILLTYGSGSIKRNGIYEQIHSVLQKCGKSVFELSGIMANPRTCKVFEGVDICRREHIDFILAVGGGSVIDCSKAIATVACMEEATDFWRRLFVNKEATNQALPLGCILTIPATGSEMNMDCVITNWEEQLKYSYASVHQYPKFSVIDPEYTYTLSEKQMVYGAVDILSHLFEIYFSKPDESNVSDDLAEALMRNVIRNLNDALLDPMNEVARSNLCWAASMALNGSVQAGKEEDWMAHKIEHAMSAFYDIAHGAGLAVCHPVYLNYICGRAPEKFARFAVRVMGCEAAGKTTEELAREGIARLRAYFKSCGAPTTLSNVGIPAAAVEKIADKVLLIPSSYMTLNREDVKKILMDCIE